MKDSTSADSLTLILDLVELQIHLNQPQGPLGDTMTQQDTSQSRREPFHLTSPLRMPTEMSWMQPQFTLGRLLTFCIINKGPRLFYNWEPWKIAYTLFEAYRKGNLHVTHKDNAITGMVIAIPVSETELSIEHILCVTKESLRLLIQKCKLWYPGKTLIYRHRGKHRKLNQERLNIYGS